MLGSKTCHRSPLSVPSGQVNDTPLPRVLSCSSQWSGGAGSADAALLQMAAQGQSFFFASGDWGAFSSCVTNPLPVPGDDPNACVGGGTMLTTGSGASWSSETVWNRSSGGISTVWPIPNYQTCMDMSGNHGSTTMRNIPDVVMVAYSICVYNPDGWVTVSGTSLSAPLWAGFAALVNQYALANGGSPLGFPNPAIYGAGRSLAHDSSFHDITTGNNANPPSNPSLFLAWSGYDLCTGWGSPIGMATIQALAVPMAFSCNPSTE